MTLLGTTDVDHHASMSEEAGIAPSEVEYLLEAAHRAFPSLGLSEADVRSTYSGVRGVIGTGAADPSKESREHALWREDGLLTVSGGKLTTFRLMAREALRAVRDALPALRAMRKRDRILEDDSDGGAALAGASEALRGRLRGRHGAEAGALVALPEGLETIGDSRVLWSELRWAARSEGVVHLDDLLLRRARVGLLMAEGGLGQMDRIRAVAQPELGWDDAAWQREEARYRGIWTASYSLPR